MKRVFILILGIVAASAFAAPPVPIPQKSSQNLGSMTLYGNGVTGTSAAQGVTVYSNGQTAAQLGNRSLYSNGLQSVQSGNRTIYSNGVTATQAGNRTIYSNGVVCTQAGNQNICR